MRNLFTLLFAMLLSFSMWGQFPLVQVTDINTVTPSQLANCNDTSSYYLDTVTVVGYVVTDGGLSEVASSSINGANGIRPFIFLNDTANNGQVAPFTGLEVMGVNWGTSQATSGFTSLIEGDLVEITGVVGMYDNATQFQPLNNNSITILNSSFPTFTPENISIADLNDQNQVNQFSTGEQWEGAFVEFNNVTVTAVNPFGSGTGARFEFTVADSAGNTMEVADFFVAQRLQSWNTLNPNSPYSNGIFTPPSVGTFFSSLKGVVEHVGSGCQGAYRLHPFDSSHYQVGQAFPSFLNVSLNPAVPSSSDSITVNAEVIDGDGFIDSVHIFWATDTSVSLSSYNMNMMTLTSSNTYSFKIPPQANNSLLPYYIRAVDNNGNTSYYPTTSPGQPNNVAFIYVRDGGLSIADVQTPFPGTSDASPFRDQQVTVKGFVTAAVRGCDLGYVYIQDTSSSEYAGIRLSGSLNIADLYRNQYVQVSGTVNESYGFTQLSVDSLKSLNSSYEIQPVELDPADSITEDEYEKYESMLISYRDPSGGKIYITDPDLGFGEYAISSVQNPSSNARQRRVLAGRQSGTNARSSLYVQLVSDSAYATLDGNMAYPPVVTDTSITMDAMTGVLWYSFGTFKLTPRTNRDIVNPSVNLDTTCSTPFFDITELDEAAQIMLYPNPASEYLVLETSLEHINISVYDLQGKLVLHSKKASENPRLDVSILKPGFYIVKVSENGSAAKAAFKVLIQ